MTLEYIPLGMINSYPPEQTPHRRDLPGNVLIQVQWKTDTREKAEKADLVARSLSAVVPHSDAYGYDCECVLMNSPD